MDSDSQAPPEMKKDDVKSDEKVFGVGEDPETAKLVEITDAGLDSKSIAKDSESGKAATGTSGATDSAVGSKAALLLGYEAMLSSTGSAPKYGMTGYVHAVLREDLINDEVCKLSSLSKEDILNCVERRDNSRREYIKRHGCPFNAPSEYDLFTGYLQPLMAGNHIEVSPFFHTHLNDTEINLYAQHPSVLARSLTPAPSSASELEWYFLSHRKKVSALRPPRQLPTGEDWKPVPNGQKDVVEDGSIFAGERYVAEAGTVGTRKLLVLFDPEMKKTGWEIQMVMKKPMENEKKIDEWAVCKLSPKVSKVLKKKANMALQKQKKQQAA